MSHTIFEDIAALKVQYPERVHFMLGNHELAEMSDYPIQKNRLLLNVRSGGIAADVRAGRRGGPRGHAAILVELPAGGPAAAGRVHLA